MAVRSRSATSVAACLCVAILVVASCGGASGTGGSALKAGQYTTLDGAIASISDFAGKPLVINFFASWCTPCRLEMPDFERVHGAVGDKVQFIGLNLQEDAGRANNVVKDTKVTYAIGLDRDGTIYRGYNGITMPMSVFLDANGKVVKTHAGALDAADLTNILHNEFGVT